jgi:enoyl-CoA hydratase/carnithine racemase
MDAFWKWLDLEPSLSVAVITGAGNKAFSAGADLKEWDNSMSADADPKDQLGNAPAFKPLSRRLGKKPVVAAVNGLAMGAGTEFVVNWYVCGLFGRGFGNADAVKTVIWLSHQKKPTSPSPK